MLEMKYSAFLANTMPPDALAPKVARASAGTVLTVWDRQHVLLLPSEFYAIASKKIQEMILNVNASFIIFKTIQHAKSQLNSSG